MAHERIEDRVRRKLYAQGDILRATDMEARIAELEAENERLRDRLTGAEAALQQEMDYRLGPAGIPDPEDP